MKPRFRVGFGLTSSGSSGVRAEPTRPDSISALKYGKLIRDWISKNGTFAWMHIILVQILSRRVAVVEIRVVLSIKETTHLKTFRL